MSVKTAIAITVSVALLVISLWWSLTRGYDWVSNISSIEQVREEPLPVVVSDAQFNAPDFDEIDESFIPSPSIVPHYLYSHSEQTRTI